MNLYKRGNIWWIKYQVGGVIYRKSTGCTRQTDAKNWLSRIDIARNMPTFEAAVEVLRTLFGKPSESGVPLEGAWDQYVKLAQAVGKLTIKPRTLYERQNHFKAFLRWMGTNAATISTVEKVDGTIAAKYAEELAKSGLSTATRGNIIGDLNVVWGLLEKLSGEIKNPWGKLAPADTDRKRINYFTDVQTAAVLEGARIVGKDWLPVCIVAKNTGLRYGDIARMTWSQVDLARRVISVKPSKTERFGVAVRLTMTDELYETLRGLSRQDEYLFPLHSALYGKRGKSVQRQLSFREVLDSAGIEGNYTFHSWRHTVATRLAEAGVSKDTRKMILGHTTDENAERYDHAEHLDEIRKALEAASGVSS